MFDYWIVCFGFSLTCSRITMKMNTEHSTIALLYSSLSIERLLRRILRNQCWGIKVTLCDEDRERTFGGCFTTLMRIVGLFVDIDEYWEIGCVQFGVEKT